MKKTYGPPAVRFWANVDRASDERCWEWKLADNGRGYGRLKIDGRYVMAHRFAYELLVGPIPSGLTIDHLCRNRMCVNPRHLQPVTLAENARRSWPRPPKTHCVHGHPFDDASTGWQHGARYCRICARQRARARTKVAA